MTALIVAYLLAGVVCWLIALRRGFPMGDAPVAWDFAVFCGCWPLLVAGFLLWTASQRIEQLARWYSPKAGDE